MGMAYLTLAALLTSWTIMVTLWLVFLYGWRRFGVKRLNVAVPTKRKHAPLFAILALPVIVGTFYESIVGGTSSFWSLLGGCVLGVVFAAVLLFAAGEFASVVWLKSGPLARMFLVFRRGFTVPDPHGTRMLLEGHVMAAWSFILCIVVYVSIGWAKFFHLGDDPGVPTLVYVLLLMMLFC